LNTISTKPTLFLFIFTLAILATVSACSVEPEYDFLEIPAAARGYTYNRVNDNMPMVAVPAGSFWMGAAKNEPGTIDDETPLHQVQLSNYWIDKYPVSNQQYQRCVAANKCATPREDSSWSRNEYYQNESFVDYPVVYINWFDAQTYCHWAGVKLPTEAQWAYAARGPSSAIYPWGSAPPQNNLTNWSQVFRDTTAINQYPDGQSWVGGYAMSGNVWEWTADWYQEYPDSEESLIDPMGPESGRKKVARGGSYLDDIDGLRASIRYAIDPESDDKPIFGFRCAIEAKE
jgi:formylglycine-generating enzyme required for sulfatase activity